MNDFLSKEHLDTLIKTTGEHLISLYMPAHRLTQEAQQDPIRLKNLLNEVEQQLAAQDMRSPTIRELLQPGRDLLENSEFWRQQSEGLAIFLRQGEAHVLRLPINFRELTVVGEFWHVKPLLPLLAGDGRFYILALSQNQVRLLEGTRQHVAEVALDHMPTSLAEALRFDDPERELQFHTSSAPANTGRRPAIFYGSAAPEEETKTDLLRFFRQVDEGLQEILRNQRAPLVLAGVEYLLPLYREVSRYQGLLDDGLTGNPEELSPKELHKAAWPKIEPIVNAEREAAKAAFLDLGGGDRAITNLSQIVSYAHQGRVATIFVAQGQRQWAHYDAVSDQIDLLAEQQPGARDLLDLAAVQTYLNGGAVYVLDPAAMPSDTPAAAILRY